MSNDNGTARKLLDRVPASALVKELIERGVLRVFGQSQYVPGVVRARYEGDAQAFDTVQRAKLMHALLKTLAADGVVAFSETGAGPDAPPNDRVYEASILTLDPGAEMDDV